jgi:hypothetical protein
MSSATILTTGVCAHCGGIADLVADDGLRACSQEHLLLARILGRREVPEPARDRARVEQAGCLRRTSDAQLQRVVEARTARRRALVGRQLRRLCEDADELLGRVAEAARTGEAAAAAEPLDALDRTVGVLVRALCRHMPAATPRTTFWDSLDEDDVLAALTLLEELDTQLRDALLGFRGAGWRAGRHAVRLMRAVEDLRTAAATGRTRARAAVVTEGDA